MKVLFVLENTMENLEGGTEVSSRHLVGLLRKQGAEVEEWSPFNARKPIFWYTSIFGQIYILIVLLWKLVKSRVQVLHIQGKYLLPSTVLVGKILTIPTVATIRDYIVVCPIGLCLFKGPTLPRQGRTLFDYRHGFWFFLTKEIHKFLRIYHSEDNLMIRIIRCVFLIRGWFVSWWLRFWLKRADAVVAVSKYVKGVLAEHGIESQVIYNAFDPVFADDDPSTTLTCSRPRTFRSGRVARARVRGSGVPADFSGEKSGPVRILFVGKPSYGKGYDLFRSLSRNKLFEKYKFVTIGGSNKLPYLQTLQKIKEAAAVVVPSRWPEPFGRAALESLMMGTPVAATNSGGLAEIIKDGVTGVLSEVNVGSLAEGLKKTIDTNVRFRENIQSRRRQLIEKFVKMPAEKHLRLYSSLIS